MKIIDQRKVRRVAYGIAASAVAIFGGIATLELKDRIGYSIVGGISYPVDKYGQNGKSTFYSPNPLTSVRLTDEDGDGSVDKKQITFAIPRAGCKYNLPPTLEDQVLFDKIGQNFGKKTEEEKSTNNFDILDFTLINLLPFL